MDFVDWRKRMDKPSTETEENKQSYRGRRMGDYVEEQIRSAQARGDFDNLKGMGKPLELELKPDDDNRMAYGLLKNNGYVPFEIELQRQIDRALERTNARVALLITRRKKLSHRRIAPFESEKRSFNASVEKAAIQYDEELRQINSKILTLNLSTPSAMHRPILKVGELVEAFREACPHIT
ncbi:hypothetical protein KDA_36890 [Dictyobacter alpinus]|uniref:DnaJ homologue subfamily C member 28 conserved domain-containing protein n=1 Tax=Dictyobacter alpinus TaxID=2014873 RepID=A0A402BA29_9CHLR|nr:DUF1992 domain-containing protein [Dictyobacter alpinus]GCE28205.1 hypothetical protein KDA_36890 [Dictyobacter alpinus]